MSLALLLALENIFNYNEELFYELKWDLWTADTLQFVGFLFPLLPNKK